MKHTTCLLIALFLSWSVYAAPNFVSLSDSSTANVEVRRTAIEGPLDPEDQYLLDVSFENLSYEDFHRLHAQFLSFPERSFVEGETYRLEDFLPSFLKAVVNKRYLENTIAVPTEVDQVLREQGFEVVPQVYSDANCHSLSWQWVNHLQGKGSEEAYFFKTDGNKLYAELPEGGKIPFAEAQAGDLIFIKGSSLHQHNEMLHSMIYLGEGLVFEKGNPTRDYPYRVAYLSDIIVKYERLVKDVSFHAFRNVPSEVLLPGVLEEHSVMNPRTALAFGLNLEKLPAGLLGSYSFTEEWDSQADQAIYILARIPSTESVEPEYLVNATAK